jgi:hypothetical protein
MESPYIGPYTVVLKDGDHYFLKDAVGAIYHRRVTRSELKLASSAEKPIEGSQYYIDRIVGHKQDVTTGEWFYLIRWTGMDASNDQWTSAKDIESSAIVNYNKGLPKLLKSRSQNYKSKKNLDAQIAKDAAKKLIPELKEVIENRVPHTPVKRKKNYDAIFYPEKKKGLPRKSKNSQKADC